MSFFVRLFKTTQKYRRILRSFGQTLFIKAQIKYALVIAKQSKFSGGFSLSTEPRDEETLQSKSHEHFSCKNRGTFGSDYRLMGANNVG